MTSGHRVEDLDVQEGVLLPCPETSSTDINASLVGCVGRPVSQMFAISTTTTITTSATTTTATTTTNILIIIILVVVIVLLPLLLVVSK